MNMIILAILRVWHRDKFVTKKDDNHHQWPRTSNEGL